MIAVVDAAAEHPSPRPRAAGSASSATPVAVVSDHSIIGQVLAVALRDLGFATRHLGRGEALSPDEVGGLQRCEPGAELVVLVLEPKRRRRLGVVAQAEVGLVTALRESGHTVLLLVNAASLDAADVDTVEATAAAIEAGAAGVLDTSDSLDTLLKSLTVAAAGHLPTEAEPRRWMARHEITVNRRQHLRQRLRQLSPRERQILHALYHGQRPATIATRCGIAIATVRSQIRSILIKLDVHSQLEAVALLHQDPLPDYVEAELAGAASLDISSA